MDRGAFPLAVDCDQISKGCERLVVAGADLRKHACAWVYRNEL